jgi:CHAT domain-containing protein
VLAELSSGRYDLVHYAGHAFFDADVPEKSGLLCADEALTGTDLSSLGNLPQLVFFNACESGRLRMSSKRDARATKRSGPHGFRVAPAEAFLRGGIANFVGTYWPVGDAAADLFSTNFYTTLLRGSSIGAAILAGRLAVSADDSVDWSDYIHYGDPGSRLFAADEGHRPD